jgi:hypothetical protein
MTMLPTARSLDDLARSGAITTVFRSGATGLGHHWELRSAAGELLARTARVHSGGKMGQAFWKFLSMTALDAGNDIHVELRGVDDGVLARGSSVNDKPAVVTVTDPSGRQVTRSTRENDAFTVYDGDDQPLAQLRCDGDGPWPARGGADDVLGELVAGEPGLSTSPSVARWVWDPQLTLSSAAYAKGQHLGLRRVVQYTFVPRDPQPTVALALLPVLAALTY